MKKNLFVIILLFQGILTFAKNFKLPVELSSDMLFLEFLFISDSKLKLQEVSNKHVVKDHIEGVKHIKTINYKIKHDYGIPYIELEDEIPAYLFGKTELSSEARRKLYFICGLNKEEYFVHKFGGVSGYHIFDSTMDTFNSHVRVEYIKASSYLTEKIIHYDESNLALKNWEIPWVENVPGYGIGEYVEIKDVTPEPYKKKINYLLILNGYFSVEKPYLYKQNSRVKQIKVTGLNSGKEKILDVLDTPHPQTVDISFLETQEPFRVTIMDVYKGTKYDDTCINCMEPYPYAVIPYEDSIGE